MTPRAPLQFPLALDFTYKADCASGCGQTVRIGSREMVARLDRCLPDDVALECWVQWPASLPNGTPLQLVLICRTVRLVDGGTLIRIAKFDFKTRARVHAMPDWVALRKAA